VKHYFGKWKTRIRIIFSNVEFVTIIQDHLIHVLLEFHPLFLKSRHHPQEDHCRLLQMQRMILMLNVGFIFGYCFIVLWLLKEWILIGDASIIICINFNIINYNIFFNGGLNCTYQSHNILTTKNIFNC
jgi:hypothetical protein